MVARRKLTDLEMAVDLLTLLVQLLAIDVAQKIVQRCPVFLLDQWAELLRVVEVHVGLALDLDGVCDWDSTLVLEVWLRIQR